MRRELLEFLREITPEEQAVLDGGGGIRRELYTSRKAFVVDSRRLLERGRLIEIRPHTRFAHFPRHRHNYVEMVYQCAGSASHIVDHAGRREAITLRAGDLLFLNQNTAHEILPTGADDLAVNFIILPQFFSRPISMIERENVLRDFLLAALSGAVDATGCLHIRARELGQPEYTLSRLLKKYTGSNFKELLQQRRLQQAAYLLAHTPLPVEAVMSYIGYGNSSYFYRRFRLRYGCSPREYRISESAASRGGGGT